MKRIQIHNIVYLVSILFTLIVVAPIGYNVLTSFRDSYTGSHDSFIEQGQIFMYNFNYLIPLLIIGVGGVVIYIGFNTPNTSPIFLFIGVLTLTVLLYGVNMILPTLTSTLSLLDTGLHFSILAGILVNFNLWILFIGALALIGIYSGGRMSV